MKTVKMFALPLFLLSVVAGSGAALADTTEAMCEMRKDGETKQGATGPCTFSQRQGYVSIELRNGDRIELSPADKPDHFKDEKGKTVVRTVTGNGQEYKWDGKKLIVRWNADSGASSGSGSETGDTPHALRDLVGARASSGEDALLQRGYSYRNGSTSGDAKYSNWRENSTGRCITVRTEDGRYASIVHVPELDCQKGGAAASSPPGDAKVAGTDFHATGEIPCSMGGGQPTRSCPFGVTRRGGGSGTVTVTRPDGRKRVIFFEKGLATGYDKSQADTGEFRTSRQEDLSIVQIGGERYEIPDAVINGG